MSLRISVINGKGGCGKSTVSTHLAAALASSGLNTALVDLDRHRGATRWHQLRPKSSARIALADWRKDFGKVPKGAQRLVIDCPASLRLARVREVVANSDILVVPLLPSIFDENATKSFLDRLNRIKKVRKGRKSIKLVTNRFRPRSIESKRLDDFLRDLGHVPDVHISDRSVYPQLAARGLTVFDRQTKQMQTLQEEWMPLVEGIEMLA